MQSLSNMQNLASFNRKRTPTASGGEVGPPSDYIAKYLLDGNGADEGATYALTMANVTYTTPAGASQEVVVLNGTNSAASGAFANPDGDTGYSISFFVYPTSLASGQRRTEKNLSGSYTWNNDIDATNVNISFRAGGSNFTASYPKSNFSTNTRYHIILEFAGNTSGGVKMYVDKVNVATSVGITNASLSGDSQKIYLGSGGSGTDTPTARAACHMGLCTVYDRVLTAGEKEALYDEGVTALGL